MQPSAIASPSHNLVDFCLLPTIQQGNGSHVALAGTVDRQDYEMSYDAFRELTGRAARGLKEQGVQPGQHVMINLPDGPNLAATILGACQIGAVAVMTKHSDGNTDAQIDKVRQDISLLAMQAGANLVIGGSAYGFTPFDMLINGRAPLLDIYPVLPTDPAICLYSGGTTNGVQKLAVHPHQSYTRVSEYVSRHLGYSPADRTLSIARLSFGYATGGNLLFPLRTGASAVLCSEAPTPQAIFSQIKRFRPTIVLNTPAIIAKMLEWAEAHPDECDLSSVRMMTSAGEKLPLIIYERWANRFPNTPLCDALGFAEHWHFVSINLPREIIPGTVGRVIPGLEVKICDESGEALPVGQEGLLYVRGPAMALGYYNNPEGTAAAFRDGWFVPGDRARLIANDDGTQSIIYIGRSGNSGKVSGEWVFTEEIQNRLLAHPAVSECAVILHDNEKGFTKPAAFVALRESGTASEEELKRFVLEALKPAACPQRFIFLDKLPRSGHDKISLGELRAMLTAQR